MSKYVIGIDPDSKAHGFAVYEHGVLIELRSMTLMQLMVYMQNIMGLCEPGEWIEVHIENVCGQDAAFAKKGVKNAKAGTAINRSIGRCQQAQIEVERMIDHLIGKDKITRHKISKRWKDAAGRKQFELATGWKGRSNEDTRSAAYFGQLGL